MFTGICLRADLHTYEVRLGKRATDAYGLDLAALSTCSRKSHFTPWPEKRSYIIAIGSGGAFSGYEWLPSASGIKGEVLAPISMRSQG
jgi:hypothetical protein